jgi:hypothetical protein
MWPRELGVRTGHAARFERGGSGACAEMGVRSQGRLGSHLTVSAAARIRQAATAIGTAETRSGSATNVLAGACDGALHARGAQRRLLDPAAVPRDPRFSAERARRVVARLRPRVPSPVPRAAATARVVAGAGASWPPERRSGHHQSGLILSCRRGCEDYARCSAQEGGRGDDHRGH